MALKAWLRRCLFPEPVAAVPMVAQAPAAVKAAMIVSPEALVRAKHAGQVLAHPFIVAKHPPAVTPDAGMAMDEAVPGFAWAAELSLASAVSEGQAFLGYPVLAELAQRPEYRRGCSILAGDMTAKWIRLQASGDGDKSEKLRRIEDEMSRLDVKGCFRKAAEQDGFFGRGHIYMDFGNDEPSELAVSIGTGRDAASKSKVAVGSLKRLKPLEAVWCYPTSYNSNDPLSEDWYRPATWHIMGKPVHASRLLTFIGREVPDLLKPAYSFGGLPLTQMARPYVDNWLNTRQSVADIVSAFSVFVLKTNMTDQLGVAGDAAGLFRRLDLFNALRNNRGVMAIDKDMEEFENISAPLGTLDALQGQSQEHMASVFGIPVVKFFGITPAGLNTSTEGEIKVYEDGIKSAQEAMFRPLLERVLDFVQLSLFGEIDPTITFEFEPLGEMDMKERAEINNIEAQTDSMLVESGILSVEEVRKRIASDDDTAYQGLDVDEVPLPEAEGLALPGVDPAPAITAQAA